MRLLLASLVCLCCTAAQAETGAFLKVQPGARVMSLGQAYTAVADDLESVNTNPAGLSRMENRQASFAHAELFEGAKLDAVSVGTKGVALSVLRLGQGKLEGRDAQGNPNGGFSAADTAVSLSGAFRGLGATVKVLDSRLADRSATSFALDLGAQRAVRGVTLGAAVRNLGPGLRYSDQTEPLPLSAAVGAAARLGGAFLLSAEVSHRPSTGRTIVSVGSEYAVHPAFSLRAGSGLTGMNAVGLGFGFKVRGASIDYAFSPAGELGTSQRIGLSSRF